MASQLLGVADGPDPVLLAGVVDVLPVGRRGAHLPADLAHGGGPAVDQQDRCGVEPHRAHPRGELVDLLRVDALVGEDLALRGRRGRAARGRGSRRGPRTVSPESEYSCRYSAGSSSRVASPRLLPGLQTLRHATIGSREGASGRRVTDASRRQRQGPERRELERAGDVRRDRGATGLHRCIVGATSKELDGGRTRAASSLATSYDLLMFDLDGVVYVDGHAVDHAAEGIADSRGAGAHIAFITNNASRTPEQVAEPPPGARRRRDLGRRGDLVPGRGAAAARRARRRGPDRGAGGGGPASRRCARPGWSRSTVGDRRRGGDRLGLRARGAVEDDHAGGGRDPERAAVGGHEHRPDAAHRRRAGARPRHARDDDQRLRGRDARGGGQAGAALFDETLRRVGGDRPLMVGDSLHTDIAGAHDAGTDSLLVMTGVTALSDLVAAAGPTSARPGSAHDLHGAGPPGLRGAERRRPVAAGGWSATVDGRPARRSTAAGRRRRMVGGGRRRPGGTTSTTTGAPADVSGLTAPGRTPARGVACGHDRAGAADRPRRTSSQTTGRRSSSAGADAGGADAHRGAGGGRGARRRRPARRRAAGGAPRGLRAGPRVLAVRPRRRRRASRRSRCRRAASGSTPSWYAAGWRGRATTPPS